jgi:hypothetical protein
MNTNHNWKHYLIISVFFLDFISFQKQNALCSLLLLIFPLPSVVFNGWFVHVNGENRTQSSESVAASLKDGQVYLRHNSKPSEV